MKTMIMNSTDITQTILLDIMHNRGTTKRQIQHRLRCSSHLIEQVIENLSSQNLIVQPENTGKIVITQIGINSLVTTKKPGYS